MVEYQFYLDNNLVEDPIGWNESKRKLIRSDKYRGLFLEYINDVTFHSSGYDYILNKQRTSICTDIRVAIYHRCSEFDPLLIYFEGYIKLSEIEVDLEQCKIKCQIEDATLSALLSARGDVHVRFDAAKTLGGSSSITWSAKTILIHDVLTGAYSYSRSGYQLSDVFSNILSYISDGSITFASNFLTSGTQARSSMSIVFTNPLVDLVNTSPTPNVSIEYYNAFGELNIATAVKQATVAATLNYLISQLNLQISGLSPEEKFYHQNYRFINKATTNGTNTITMLVDITGYSIYQVIGASVTAGSIGSFIGATNVMNRLSLLNGNQLRNDNKMVPSVSFNQLFDIVNKHFDMGMSLTRTSGLIQLRIEPISYFLTNTQSVVLNNVTNLKYKISNEFAKDLVSVGDGGGDTNRGAGGNQTFRGEWSVSASCTSNKLDLKTDYIVDSANIYEQLSRADNDNNNDEEIYLLECEASSLGAGTIITAKYENIIYSSTAAANVKYYAYNAKLTNYWKIYNWFVNIRGNITFENFVMTNPIVPKLIAEYNFEYPITSNDQNTIINNGDNFINFNPGTDILTEKAGWIKEIVFDNKTGMGAFKLLTTL